MNRHRWIVEALLFSGLALTLTWPLARNLATAIPFGTEQAATVPLASLWAVWWNVNRIGDFYQGYWDGYYAYGWTAAYAPGYLSTETTVAIETLVYDLEQNVLLWAGTSETTNPGDREAFIAELVTAASREMRRVGVIAR